MTTLRKMMRSERKRREIQQATGSGVEWPARRLKRIRKNLEDKVMRSLERTRKNKEEAIKGKRLEQKYEVDNFETVRKKLDIIMETKVEEGRDKPMQFMALEAARLDTEKHDAKEGGRENGRETTKGRTGSMGRS